MTHQNQPSFPRDYRYDGHNGLTKREYFAAMALTAMADNDETPTTIAKTAVEIADALIEALNQKEVI